MNIKEISEEIYQNNVLKGFWDQPRNVGEVLMLVVSELAEALEADRKNRMADINKLEEMKHQGFVAAFEAGVKDTFEDEMADATIRIFDICQGFGIDLEKHIELKMRYNKTRPKMHGKKY